MVRCVVAAVLLCASSVLACAFLPPPVDRSGRSHHRSPRILPAAHPYVPTFSTSRPLRLEIDDFNFPMARTWRDIDAHVAPRAAWLRLYADLSLSLANKADGVIVHLPDVQASADDVEELLREAGFDKIWWELDEDYWPLLLRRATADAATARIVPSPGPPMPWSQMRPEHWTLSAIQPPVMEGRCATLSAEYSLGELDRLLQPVEPAALPTHWRFALAEDRFAVEISHGRVAVVDGASRESVGTPENLLWRVRGRATTQITVHVLQPLALSLVEEVEFTNALRDLLFEAGIKHVTFQIGPTRLEYGDPLGPGEWRGPW